MDNIDSPLRLIRSYVKREGRFTPAQRKAIESFWSVYGLELDGGLLDFQRDFKNFSKIVLEIGFGNGETLFEMATQAPKDLFIGVEVYRSGVGRLLKKAFEQQLKNLRVFNADALDVLAQCIPEHSLDRVQIFFPDPWRKKRHHKRRLIKKDFLLLLSRKLKRGGILHIATDWENYAEQIRALLEQMSEFHELTDSKEAMLRPRTKFEKRGEKLGHSIHDFVFAKS
ncbi:MAG: tRNA (guanosine(46)-N7)-methyltransferase TrmB [Gammaproteobacteria bacterium]|nr:tRNA (guanosine(46)-N7)-methyltransferase TrmB [Gammaproteobacteria bacterium]MBU1558784.1 tRNA (guanosine(46)-N7)-methyltransferase TrmB [Gammaproteobacteria bacterium]MBU1926190.1 tRNA (guanosine(46)-N7)-methyltransferase TrmB [Gammaproteobacteria bacterium]MBU2545548.1 tRNA (guanosine(46)-N7)-methyltransferase TrmB [Gammaproteobacteria bacterium]